jgi:hypothetical protein
VGLPSVTVGVEGRHIGVQLSAGHTSETVDQYDATPEPGFDWHYRTDKQIYDTNPVGASLTWKFDTGIVLGAGPCIRKNTTFTAPQSQTYTSMPIYKKMSYRTPPWVFAKHLSLLP